MATSIYHITFEALDRKIIEAEVEATYTLGEGFDSFVFEDVVVTDPKTGESDFYDFMPEEYVSEAEYDATCHLPDENA